MTKPLREGATYSQQDVMEILIDFSSFKNRVQQKFKDLARELGGKPHEHKLWVNLYLVSSDYAKDAVIRSQKSKGNEIVHSINQPVTHEIPSGNPALSQR